MPVMGLCWFLPLLFAWLGMLAVSLYGLYIIYAGVKAQALVPPPTPRPTPPSS
jgi:hypothetical protein